MKEKLLMAFKSIKGKKKILIVGMIIIVVLVLGYAVFRMLTLPKGDPTEIKDAEGNLYQIKKVGDKFWMTENIKVVGHTEGKSLCYKNEDQNCEEKGRLYDWEAAMVACPDGWRLPTRDEWVAMESNRDGINFQTAGHSWDTSFYEMGRSGMWWLSTSEDHGAVWSIKFNPESEEFEQGTFSPDHYFSVRCIEK